MTRSAPPLAALALIAFAACTPFAARAAARGDARRAAPPAADARAYTPESMKWVEAPPMFPRGTRMFVMEGNPARPGPWTLRLWLPASFRQGPYFRLEPERLTVMLGTLIIGVGDVFSDREGIPVHAGSFATVPPREHHTLWTRDVAVVQMHGTGPWDLRYVNPADDPRHAAERKRAKTAAGTSGRESRPAPRTH